MPKRRTHNKSRYGCDQCRKRRVKCDENPPRCTNCLSRNEICIFSRIAPPGSNQTSEPGLLRSNDVELPAQQQDTRDAKQPQLLQFRPDRQAELQLMHQWFCYTFKSAGSQWDKLFQEYIPRLSLEHDYLLASMFALSSFHLAADALDHSGDSEVARQHMSVGLEYQAHAISGLRKDLDCFAPENAAPVLFASILVAAGAIVSPLLPVGPGDETRPAAEAFLPLVDHLKSIESIKDVTVKHMRDKSVAKYVDKNWKSTEIERPLYTSELRRLNEIFSPYPRHRQMYEKVIVDLEKLSRSSDAIPNWLVEAGPEFLDKLCRGEGVAIALYLHWGTLLDQLEDIWWAKFSGRRLVEELSTRLDGMGPEWANIASWCRKQVEIIPANVREENYSDMVLRLG